MKLSNSFNVIAGDIDEQGHVNNVAYLRWIQDIAVAHWRHAASDEMIAKFSWIVVRHEIDYKKQAFENEIYPHLNKKDGREGQIRALLMAELPSRIKPDESLENPATAQPSGDSAAD